MNFLKTSLLGFCLFFCMSTFAGDFSEISSKNGIVILKSGEKISGQIRFFYKSDLLQVVVNAQQSKAFTAHNVDRFRFYDERFDTDRVFVSVDLRNHGYGKHGFYEVISWGSIEVLGRLKYQDKSYTNIYETSILDVDDMFVPKLIAHDYYVYYKDEFLPLKKFYEQVLEKYCEKDGELIEYLKSEHLNHNDVYTHIRIIAYYNQKAADQNFDMAVFLE